MALSRKTLGDMLVLTTTFKFMDCFNSLSFFFFCRNDFKSEFCKTAAFSFLTGFNLWAGSGLVTGFAGLMSKSGFGWFNSWFGSNLGLGLGLVSSWFL